MMHQYGVHDVEKLLGLPRSTIRALIAGGFVSPGARAAQLAAVFLPGSHRAAHRAGAASANVPHRRITASLKELRRLFRRDAPVGTAHRRRRDRVVVSEGGRHWQAESGQYLLAFEGDPVEGSLSVTTVRSRQRGTRDNWFEPGCRVRAQRSRGGACAPTSRRSRPIRITFVARINLGRLLHESGELARAEQVYRDAIDASGADPLLLFNSRRAARRLGIAKVPRAVRAYEAAVRCRIRTLPTGHYNPPLSCFVQLENQQGCPVRHMFAVPPSGRAGGR
jgi:hypothetical protein